MKSQEHGVVLMVVLLLLQMISILGIYVLETSHLETKMGLGSWQRYKNLHVSEAILRDVEIKLTQHLPSCFITPVPSSILFARSVAWWRSSATCAGNFQSTQYYYVVEALGEDLCAYFDASQTSVSYYRVSLLSVSKQRSAVTRLQSTFALPGSGSVTSCSEVKHRVMLGRQMWREPIL